MAARRDHACGGVGRRASEDCPCRKRGSRNESVVIPLRQVNFCSPAKAGAQSQAVQPLRLWTPAFAGEQGGPWRKGTGTEQVGAYTRGAGTSLFPCESRGPGPDRSALATLDPCFRRGARRALAQGDRDRTSRRLYPLGAGTSLFPCESRGPEPSSSALATLDPCFRRGARGPWRKGTGTERVGAYTRGAGTSLFPCESRGPGPGSSALATLDPCFRRGARGPWRKGIRAERVRGDRKIWGSTPKRMSIQPGKGIASAIGIAPKEKGPGVSAGPLILSELRRMP